PGFISHVQAQRGKIDNPIKAASDIFPLIAKALGQQDRLQEVLVSAFVAAPSWTDARDRFDRMVKQVDKLTEAQLEKIIAAFRTNDQLYDSIYLVNSNNRLRKFLEKATDREFEIEGRVIKVVTSEDAPFF